MPLQTPSVRDHFVPIPSVLAVAIIKRVEWYIYGLIELGGFPRALR